jgi:hypothetical protein
MPLSTILGVFARERRRRIAGAPALEGFLVSRAAFAAQKVTVEYCRARAGIGWRQLTSEAGFAAALETCRWEAFAAVYPDVAETCQILLRQGGAPREAAGPGLGAAARRALLAHPVPPHRAATGGGWGDVAAELAPRLERALLAAPRAVHTLGHPAVARILELLPYHPRVKNADRDIIENGLRLALCGIYAELERKADVTRLAAGLGVPVPGRDG